MTNDRMTNRMVVAVDIRGSEEYGDFIYETFKIITGKHPQHNFVFIFDTPFDPSFIFSKNIITEIVKTTKISLVSQLKISSLLKKHKANVFVTAQPVTTNVPQCLAAFDKLKAGFFKKAMVVIASSEFSKKDIIAKYKIDGNKIAVVYKGASDFFQPQETGEKEKIKEQYADGNEYFLFNGKIQAKELLNLLKAFSVFKKRQKSNMQLLLISQNGANKELTETLRLYKFKNEVKVLENTNEKESASITAAAYAFVYPFSGEYVTVLNAMRSQVPVIINNDGLMSEISGDAAVYVGNNDHKDIADKMMLVYKDENLRQKLVEKGREQVKKYTWDISEDRLWKSIIKACF